MIKNLIQFYNKNKLLLFILAFYSARIKESENIINIIQFDLFEYFHLHHKQVD